MPLPLPRSQTRYMNLPLIPRRPLIQSIGAGEHVRLPRQSHPFRTKRCWKVSINYLNPIPPIGTSVSMVTYKLRSSADVGSLGSLNYRSCVLHRFVKDECTTTPQSSFSLSLLLTYLFIQGEYSPPKPSAWNLPRVS